MSGSIHAWQKSIDVVPVAWCALGSRVAVCTLMFLSDVLIPDWDDGDPTVAQLPGPAGLQAFMRWDAARFLMIAESGYTNEQMYAFFPGLPVTIRIMTPVFFGKSGFVLMGAIFTNACFVASAVAFHYLSQHVLGARLARRATLVYCATPASVFHSSIYTESPFSLCTFVGLLCLHGERNLLASFAFACGTCFRSNGVVNACFILYFAFLTSLHQRDLLPFLKGVALSAIVIIPYILIEYNGYATFCKDGNIFGSKENPVDRAKPAWCSLPFPSIYRHVQQTYWGNGLFKYWELKQLPNFLLALPAFTVALQCALSFFVECSKDGLQGFVRDVRHQTMLPYVVQMCALSLLSLLTMNVQVTTRLLSAACPSFHWWLAHASLDPRMRRFVLWYLGLFLVLGILLHPNRLPWT